MQLLLHLSSAFLVFPVPYSWPARLEGRCNAKEGALDLAAKSNSDGLFPPRRGMDWYARRAFAESSSFLKQVLCCLDNSLSFSIGFSIEGAASNVLKFPVFGKFANSAESYCLPWKEGKWGDTAILWANTEELITKFSDPRFSNRVLVWVFDMTNFYSSPTMIRSQINSPQGAPNSQCSDKQ